uniref:Uncharacterized protein n=1 Tax=Rhizophora mucronata TaxID=61149 RepID=A0A2P2PCX4_RHIMU
MVKAQMPSVTVRLFHCDLKVTGSSHGNRLYKTGVRLHTFLFNLACMC